MDDLLNLEHADPTEAVALAGRLRFAAESLTVEFEGLSPGEAERLIFGVARQFLSDAQIAQFVPTLATRRARQMLRSRPPGETFVELVANEAVAAAEVTIPEEPVQVGAAPAVGKVSAAAGAAAPMPPAFYAREARRLLERARALRADSR